MKSYSDYIIYVDESGNSNWSAPPEYPLLCLNFCMFKKDYYLNTLVTEFNKLKFKYWGCDNIVLHERDLRKTDKISNPAIKSKYETLRGERRKDFMDDLTGLMDVADFICFCVIIDKNKIDEKHKTYDAYHIALSRGFRQIWKYLKNNAEAELYKELHFLFESRGKNEDRELSKAYAQIQSSGSLVGVEKRYDFSNFKLELMDKKSNSTGLQFADLTARPIGNHYLHASGQKNNVDLRSANILLKKLHFCTDEKCEKGKYDIVHENTN